MNELKLEVVDKNILSKSISRRVGLTLTDIMQIINIFEDEIITAVKENKKVQLNGFLVFIPKNIEGGRIISPLDKKEYELKPKRTVVVRVGKYFRDTIKDSYSGEGEKEDADSKKPKRPKKQHKTN